MAGYLLRSRSQWNATLIQTLVTEDFVPNASAISS